VAGRGAYLVVDEPMWALGIRAFTKSSLAIWVLFMPLATSLSTSTSRTLRSLGRSGCGGR
jgi:hypothetical protein